MDPTDRIAFICPQYQQDNYSALAIHSFFATTPNGYCILLDDASPYWDAHGSAQRFAKLLPQPHGQRGMYVHHFAQNGGLTRSWNFGLRVARQQGCRWAIAGNNDVLFTPGWQEGLIEAIEAGYALVGPVSNAPGITDRAGRQEVWRYMEDYRLTDDPAYLAEVAERLRANRGLQIPAAVNGFFLFAETERWWQGRYDELHVFRPSNPVNSKGNRNPTPLMTLNEDELQGRWRGKGWQSAIVPSSFIFHYRAVSRGRKHCRGRWFRMSQAIQKESPWPA